MAPSITIAMTFHKLRGSDVLPPRRPARKIERMRTLLALILLLSFGCGDESDADRLGVGSECTATDQCDEETEQICLTAFKGGYCGIQDCVGNADCPEDSACVIHDDGTNYCFRTCLDKAECNANRSADSESNCSANVSFVESSGNLKACVPPAG